MATGCCITRGAPLDLTMRTLPSASVISSSDTLDSETRSIRVLSFLRSMGSPTTVDAGRQDQHAAFLKWKSENESVGNKIPIFFLFSLTFCFYALKRLSGNYSRTQPC